MLIKLNDDYFLIDSLRVITFQFITFFPLLISNKKKKFLNLQCSPSEQAGRLSSTFEPLWLSKIKQKSKILF